MPRREYHRFLTVLRSAREADAIIADSEATCRDLIERLGFPEDRIHTIYLGVGSEFAPVEDEELLTRMRAELHLGPRPYFLMLSSIGPRKNLGRVLEAFESLVQRPDFEHTLVVSGSNLWNFRDLAARLRESPARERIVETGHMPEMRLPALISASDALVFPSLYEGFGLPALEAMACGRPVLGSTAASLPEVVGPAGLLVDPCSVEEIREAMLTLAQDEALRQRLGQLGRERARTFTWARTAEQTLDVYETVIS
jgi:alpha-1,3-rhamnosyl/mannosyltransferase